MAIATRFYAHVARIYSTLLVSLALLDPTFASIIVNPARPVTQRLDVQIIRTSLDGGLLPATVFGTAAQQADIEADIDLVWAQAGIDVQFLPTITQYANTFAYQGSLLPRPSSDLSAIISNARTAGKLNPNSQVINMFFVQVVPGFTLLQPSYAAGVANVGGNGIAMFTGASLLGTPAKRDVIAGVVAHEIGHNLGLTHTTTGGANLMAPNGTSEQLTNQQINVALQSYLLQPATSSSDFTGDGVVNGADLDVWQNAYGVNNNGDADGDGDSDGRDFLAWQNQFGVGAFTSVTQIPEPASQVVLFAWSFAFTARRSVIRH